MMSGGATAAVARNSSNNSMSRFPFTANQWQELEHQALVYKYMISGMPIPPDLLFSIKRSLLDSTSNSKLLLHHSPHSMGWNCFQMGFGRKIDPEPGRCRRTDGKKWRCSKEAYPDSKYCERHMHRGRNRSRKPVEVNANNTNNNNTNMSTQTTTTTPPTAIPMSSISKSPNYPSSMPSDSHHQQQHHHNQVSYYNGSNNNTNSLLYSQSPSSRNMGFPTLSSSDPFLLDSASYSHSDKDYRNNYGLGMMKDEVDEHPFFSGSTTRSSSSISDSWNLEPLTMGSCSKQNGYSFLQSKQEDEQNYYNGIGLKMDREEDEPTQKVMHHFFDEWPHKNNDSSSTTQLSISMPSSHDFFVTHNDK